MAGFVDCSKYSAEQGEQNRAIENIATKADVNAKNIALNSDAIDELGNAAITAEDKLLDNSDGKGAGKITVEKIKDALSGKVKVKVKSDSGLTGDGTEGSELSLSTDTTLQVTDGKLGISSDVLKELVGKSLKKIKLVDASGKHTLGYILGE